MVQCCAFNCTEVGTIRFPKKRVLRRRWELAVSRKNFKPTAASRLCCAHFRPEDFQSERYYDGGGEFMSSVNCSGNVVS